MQKEREQDVVRAKCEIITTFNLVFENDYSFAGDYDDDFDDIDDHDFDGDYEFESNHVHPKRPRWRFAR